MPPAPKPPALRQRRNRASTRATLPTAEAAAKNVVPPLPKRVATERWHPMVKAWWTAIWTSPMAAEYLEADKDDLYVLAELRQDFYKVTTPGERQRLAAEIRQQSVRFGLSPIDRRRLQWEVEKGEQADERTRTRRQRKQASGRDPREVLKVV